MSITEEKYAETQVLPKCHLYTGQKIFQTKGNTIFVA